MNRKREAIFMGLGILAGLALSGSAAQAATSITATLCSDAAFGNLPWRRVDNPSWEQIRPGDLVRYDNSGNGHVVVVISKTDEYIKVTESGLNNHARWGGQYFKWWLAEQPGYALYTRYSK